MAIKNSTGSVITMEGVPKGHQVGIAWISEADAANVGFAYDEDETKREDVLQKVSEFCKKRGLKPFDDEQFAEHLEEPYTVVTYEEIDQEEFFERFGGDPLLEGCLFDEGGTIGNNRRVFGIDADAAMPEDDEMRAKMHKATVRASVSGIALIIIVVACFFVVCEVFTILACADFRMAAVVFLFIILIALGIGELIHLVPKVGRLMYKKMYR